MPAKKTKSIVPPKSTDKGQTKKTHRVRVRKWKNSDLPGIVACHKAAYPEYNLDEDGHYTVRNYRFQLEAFPEGQVLAEIEGKIVGYATSIIVQLDDENYPYTYDEITGGGTFTTHNPAGDSLYGADIAVDPAYRGMGVAKQLYRQRKKLVKRYNLKRMVAYGRIPGYSEFAGKLTADDYVQQVVDGVRSDPSLNAHLKEGYRVKRVMLDILEDDPSLNYCTFLEMPNPDYKPLRRSIANTPLRRPVRKIRVCVAQYMMRPIRGWEELEQSVEFFVNTADEYACHFLLLPELFTAQMFSTMPADWETSKAIATGPCCATLPHAKGSTSSAAPTPPGATGNSTTRPTSFRPREMCTSRSNSISAIKIDGFGPCARPMMYASLKRHWGLSPFWFPMILSFPKWRGCLPLPAWK